MGNVMCNIARSRVREYYNRVKSNDPATSVFKVVLLKTGDSDANYRDFDDLAALIAGASVEADFTNYARKVLTDAELSALTAPDDAADDAAIVLPNQTWTAAGGTLDNTLARAVLVYFPDTAGADSTGIPLAVYDFTPTTTGADLLLQWNTDGAIESN